MSTAVRYTAARKLELETARAAELEQRMRTYAAMSLDDYVAMRVERVAELAQWCQDAEAKAAVARHAELVAEYGAA